MLGPGDPAPNFTLRDTDRNDVSLESLNGKRTLLMFFPFAFSGTCSGEICQIRDNQDRMATIEGRVMAVTCDPVAANAAWAAHHGFDYPVLSDFWPHGEVSKAFGVFNEQLGCPNRVSFVIDEEGVITNVVASESLGSSRDFDAQIEALAGS